MGIQGLCSSLGGVFFQWLLQMPSANNVGLWVKNIYLCAFSIIFNFLSIVVLRPSLLAPSAFLKGMDFMVVPIVITSGLGGVCTSLLLRHLDAMVKEYANFAEMVIVAVAQRILFGAPIRLSLLISIVMVSYSLYL
jgi:hypothetical protein